MNSFVVCVGAVLPIFILMAVGYLCQRLGVIRREAVPAMNKVAFTVFLSTMVFNSIYTSDLAASVDPFLLAYTAVAAIVVFAAATAVVNATVPVENQKGVMIQGMFRSNFVMVGLAVAENLLPPGEMGTVAVLVAVIIPIYNVLAVVTLSAHGGEATSWAGVVRKIATNPLIIATVLALAMAIASFTMAQQMGGDAELAGDIVVATSVLCPFTIFGFAYGLMSLGLIAG